MPSRFRGAIAKLAFGLLIAATSADALNKYLGYGGIAGYTAFCIVAVFLIPRLHLAERFARVVDDRLVVFLAGGTLAFLIAACLAIYPLADSGKLGDGGSDADDALIVGAQSLIH